MDNIQNEGQHRKKRVAMLKKIIVITMFILIIFPTVLCVILSNRISRLESKLNGLAAYSQSASMEVQKSGYSGKEPENVEDNGKDGALNNENIDNHEYVEGEDIYPTDVKKVYLTFDDGPSDNTDTILNILDEYNVKASFFVILKTDEESVELYNRILNEGHTLAMHSTSHVYSQVYSSMDSFVQDVSDLQSYLKDITGYIPRIYRFPGGSSNTVSKVDIHSCIDYLDSTGITYYDWNVASGDATGQSVSTETIITNVITGIENHDNSVVLMHDANNKISTVEALPAILQQLTDMGVLVLPITEKTTPIHHKIN